MVYRRCLYLYLYLLPVPILKATVTAALYSFRISFAFIQDVRYPSHLPYRIWGGELRYGYGADRKFPCVPYGYGTVLWAMAGLGLSDQYF